MLELSYVCGAIALIVLSILDLKDRRLPVVLLIGISIALAGFRIFYFQYQPFLWMAGGVLGVGFLLISKVTKEAIGYGDSWIIVLLGIFLGIWEVILLLLITFFITGLVGMVLILRKADKGTGIPMVPIVTIAYLGMRLM